MDSARWERLQALFHDAVDLPAAGRDAPKVGGVESFERGRVAVADRRVAVGLHALHFGEQRRIEGLRRRQAEQADQRRFDHFSLPARTCPALKATGGTRRQRESDKGAKRFEERKKK